MNKTLYWIRNNKIRFFIIDSVLLILNIVVYNIFRIAYFSIYEIINRFFVTGAFFGAVLFLSIYWPKVTKKFHYFFIQIKILDVFWRKMLYFGMIFFGILNITFSFLFWININFMEEFIVFYFAMPWLVVICANGYNSIVSKTNFKEK